jgi:hypothetical protein
MQIPNHLYLDHMENLNNINLPLLELIQSFKSNSKSKYKDFVAYVYITFDNKINCSKSQSIKNKYIKIRKDLLQYVVANERAITSEISKRNK